MLGRSIVTMGVQWAFSFGAGMALIAALLALILMVEHNRSSPLATHYSIIP